jgi:hypothetical protein
VCLKTLAKVQQNIEIRKRMCQNENFGASS